jgi:CRISPR/Cas system-associated exonuclease Cas4 (RecB family)
MAPPDLNHGRDVWTELAFEVPIEGEVLVGSVDRLIQQAEEGLDRYSMIDFKVAQHPKSAHQIIHAYSTQIQLYAWAIQTLRVNRERPFTFEASVVHISSGSVQSVPIPIDLGRVNSLVNRLREESLKVIAGQVGEPRRGSYCQFCRHEQYCVEDKE